ALGRKGAVGGRDRDLVGPDDQLLDVLLRLGVGELEAGLDRITEDRGRTREWIGRLDEPHHVRWVPPLEQDAEIEPGRIGSDARDFHYGFLLLPLRMILPENRFPLFGIMR